MHSQIIQDRLQFILEHASVIDERVRDIEDEERFLNEKDCLVIIDSLITRLQARSENIKKIQKLDPPFFRESLPIDITPIIRSRDLASHHYEALDHAMILHICKSKVPLAAKAVQSFLEKL
jgi:uncharacterized protein with HEPN domain